LENQFFGSNKVHRLRDAFLDHSCEYTSTNTRRSRKRRPRGPLVVSYVHERMANPIEDRFDYVFISDEIGVTECSYDYQGARVAGSDHGIATAELQLC
jgi:hypothetical protein